MPWISVDVESDGPAPGLYSMISFGAVVIEPALDRTFKGKVAPIAGRWLPDALAVSGISREQHVAYRQPGQVMRDFEAWLGEVSPKTRPTFVSDNPAFDFAFISYYFHAYAGRNPFGHSARRIGDLYAGMKGDAGEASAWKKTLRKTAHTHDPVDDAKGNAEAVLAMRDMGLKIGGLR